MEHSNTIGSLVARLILLDNDLCEITDNLRLARTETNLSNLQSFRDEEVSLVQGENSREINIEYKSGKSILENEQLLTLLVADAEYTEVSQLFVICAMYAKFIIDYSHKHELGVNFDDFCYIIPIINTSYGMFVTPSYDIRMVARFLKDIGYSSGFLTGQFLPDDIMEGGIYDTLNISDIDAAKADALRFEDNKRELIYLIGVEIGRMIAGFYMFSISTVFERMEMHMADEADEHS